MNKNKENICPFKGQVYDNNIFVSLQDILNHILNDVEIFMGKIAALEAKSTKKNKKKKKGKGTLLQNPQTYSTRLISDKNIYSIYTVFSCQLYFCSRGFCVYFDLFQLRRTWLLQKNLQHVSIKSNMALTFWFVSFFSISTFTCFHSSLCGPCSCFSARLPFTGRAQRKDQ